MPEVCVCGEVIIDCPCPGLVAEHLIKGGPFACEGYRHQRTDSHQCHWPAGDWGIVARPRGTTENS